MSDIEFNGTGGIIEGNLGTANVNVNLDASVRLSTGNTSGEGNYIGIPSNAAIEALETGGTVSAWCKFNSTGSAANYPNVIGLGSGGGSGLSVGIFRHSTNDTLFYNVKFADGTNSYLGSSSITLGTWNHVAISFDSGAYKSYFNGVLVNTNTTAQDLFTISTATRNSDVLCGAIGTNLNNTESNTNDMEVADARIYSSALSQADIQILASKIQSEPSLVSASSDLLLRYKLDGNDISSSTVDNAEGTSARDGIIKQGDGTASTQTLLTDAYSVDVYDNSTTTDGTFTVTQGKVEGLALTSVDFDGTASRIDLGTGLTIFDGATEGTVSGWIRRDAAGNVDTIISHFDSSDSNRQFNFQVNASNKAKFIVQNEKNNFNSDHDAVGATNIDTNEWYHLVGTFSTTNGQKVYVNGVHDGTATTTIEDALDTVTTDAHIGVLEQGGSYTGHADGEIRDVKLFDYELSAEQILSLYSGTYPQTPNHHYKLDEGSGGNGTTVADSGTDTTLNGTLAPAGNAPNWINGTLDLDGNLTIAANGTLSAPRGEIQVAGSGVGSVDINGTYIHNNGLFHSNSGDGQLLVSGVSFYNLKGSGTNAIKENCTVENAITMDSANRYSLYISNGVTVTVGTTASAGSITSSNGSSSFFGLGNRTTTVQGASSLYPVVISGAGFDLDDSISSSATLNFSNADWQIDMTTGGNGLTVNLTGDCEFDAVTVSSGDTLDLNGQRMTTSGQLSGAGTFTGTNGLLSVADLRCDGFSSFDLQNTDIMFNASCSPRMNGSPSNKARTMFVQAGDVVGMARATTTVNNVIAAGDLRQGNNDQDMALVDLTIPVGGNLNTQTRTGISYTCSGDFTTSGGLIGKSAVVFDQDTGEIITSTLASAPSTAITLEAWVKSDDVTQYQTIIIDRSQSVHLAIYNSKLYIWTDTDDSARVSVSGVTTLTNNKWHHLAMTWDAATDIMSGYVDGKLEISASSVGDNLGSISTAFGVGRREDVASQAFDGVIAMTRIFNVGRTQAQLRTDMFNDFANMSNTTGLLQMFQFDEGTGTSVDDVSANSNTGTITGAAWAGAGTFTCGTSTIDMTGNGTWTYQGTIQFHNFKVAAASKTTTYKRLSNGVIYVKNNLYIGAGTFTRNSSVTWGLGYDTNAGSAVNTGTGTILSGATDPINFSSSYVVYFHDLAGTFNANTKFEYLITSNPLTLTNSLETTGYLWASNNTIDIADQTCTTPQLRMNDSANAKVTMSNGTLNLTSTNQAVGFEPNFPSNTFTAGPGATVSGPSGAGRANFTSQPNFVVVGKVEKLNVTNEELSVTGQVINCTGDIIQQFPTIDHDQQLDFDTADDRDIILGRDLDKNTELINS